MDRKEAIEIVKKNYPHVTASGSEFETALRELIPELAESEDERIRKKIITIIKNETGWQQEFPSQNQCLAWLEKQKERGPLTKEEEYTLNRIIEYLEDESCPLEWRDLLGDIHNLPYTQQKEQKPAEWSEEDEAFLKVAIAICNRYSHKDIADWLKSLRPQPHRTSEDEERLINTSISFLKDFADKGYENAVECIDWLKSKLNGNSGK